MSNEIQTRDADFLTSDSLSPEQVVQRGVEIAQALTDLIANSKMWTKVQGKPYVTTEGWQATCSMMRVFPVEVQNVEVLQPAYDDTGKMLHGYAFEATVELRRADGTIVSRASTRCGGPDDRPWDKRPAPAVKSMAGTRAFNKAARLVFGWIIRAKPGRKKEGDKVVEIQFEATPADEVKAALGNDDLEVRKSTKLPEAPKVAKVEVSADNYEKFLNGEM